MKLISDSIIADSIYIKEILNTNTEKICAQIEEQTVVLNHAITEFKNSDNYFDFISNDTLFTTIITISIFSIGILINSCVKKMEIRKRNNNIKKFIKKHLDEIVNYDFKEIIKEFRQYSELLSDNEELISYPPNIETSNIEKIMSLNVLELFDSVKEKDQILNIGNDINFLYKIFNDSKKYRVEIIKTIDFQHEKMVDCLHNFTNSLLDFSNLDGEFSTEEIRFKDIINDYLENHFANLPRSVSLKEMNNVIVSPIKEFILQNQSLRRKREIKTISDTTDNLLMLFNKNKSIAEEIKNKYSGFSEDIDEIIDNLNLEILKINWL